MSMATRTCAAALALAAVVSGQPALAQAIRCDQLRQLQTWGKDRFAAIAGETDDLDRVHSTFLLDGAQDCILRIDEGMDPRFQCTWTGYPDQASAEAARLSLKNQVVACLDQKFSQRDVGSNSTSSENYYTRISFGTFQPNILIKRRYLRSSRRHLVEFEFQMNLPGD